MVNTLSVDEITKTRPNSACYFSCIIGCIKTSLYCVSIVNEAQPYCKNRLCFLRGVYSDTTQLNSTELNATA